MSNKTNNLKAYLRDLYEGIVSKKPDASRNPQNFRSEIEAIRTGGELYEVMDASELPEDAPNGSLALVEGEPIPEAYTVSSVDELPSNAVDGSMAIVSMVGNRWALNDTLTPFADEEPHQMLFEGDDGTTYTGIKYGSFGPPAYAIMYLFGDGQFVVYGFEGSSNFGVKEGWRDEYDKYINVYQADQEATNWLNSNGRITVENVDIKQFFYTHENGQWVYKGEFV